ncbi:MAG TPA: glycosyltransferase [Longimicrobiaceae bacterium]|nr:glycosyltransferase [Longimicrobiaceae bacterium]
MKRPRVSVVTETITARFDNTTGSLPDDLATTLHALDRQTYPRELIERVVVLDEQVAAATAEELGRRYPAVRFVAAPATNYFAAKNAGAEAATGEIVALLDSDCEPQPDWLERLVAPFAEGAEVAAVAGRTRYTGGSWAARTFSIPDFAYVHGEQGGEASGFNINNVAFRREAFLAHRFDERIPRNGGCYFLYHQMRAAGARIVYDPRAVVSHAVDVHGLGFVRKHFERGHDGVVIYRLDERAVLRGTPFVRRFGPLALVALSARRILVDWLRLARHRRQMGVPAITLPYYAAVAVGTRLIELAGGMSALASGRARTGER